ncbi:MAG: Imm10 family immunity protein [Bacteroidota bacterium]
MKISIDTVSIEEDEEGILVVALINSKNENNCIMLQFQETLSDQDIELGWSKYYIGTCDGSIGNYSCIEKVHLLDNTLVFNFNKTGLSTFNVENIEISIPATEFRNVKAVLVERFELEDAVKLVYE